jgi:hypothetical protein
LGQATKELREKSRCKDIYVRMLTYTRDGKGFLLEANQGETYNKIKKSYFKDSNSKNYKNSRTLFHFNYNNTNGGIDYRHVIYNKTVGLIMNESLGKKVSMGTKALFHCSSTMRGKHLDAKNSCMFRHELTKELHSVQEEEDFLQNNS